MPKLSVLIPSRNEKFLLPTVEGCFSKAAGEVEVVVVLEGYWPDGWKELAAKYPNLHTIHHGEPKGLRPSINEAAASAISRGTKCLFKLDAHCLLDEGYDVKIQADLEPNWVVVPRRERLDAENWCIQDSGKPPIDYHYLSFPDDPNDFGGAGLNGKVWLERAAERFNKPEYDVDWEMSSQGSAWAMRPAYFQQLELMDDKSYGTFWNEMQEIGLKAWLSGGQLMVNKKTWYAHLHKGRRYGRGYHLQESLLKQGRNHTMKWLFNEAWPKQTLPFKTLIERFWPVPTWPENWEELVYGSKGQVRHGSSGSDGSIGISGANAGNSDVDNGDKASVLVIHSAHYGISDSQYLDVKDVLQTSVVNGSLDIIVTNDSLKVGNPFRGHKKRLTVVYSYDGGEPVTVTREERDWLIIGQSAMYVKQPMTYHSEVVSTTVPQFLADDRLDAGELIEEPTGDLSVEAWVKPIPLSASALNDALIRRFKIPDRRLRGPMPIEVPTFHRDDLAKLFAELGFNKGAEIGVAEGNYSEVLLKANPQLELWLVDPWTKYSDNPRAHSEEHQAFSLNETMRKTAGYNVHIVPDYSMNAVRDVPLKSLDFCYIDGHHGFDYAVCDLVEWSKRVRSGGIVAGDDYYAMKWGGVVEAVQAYTNAHAINPWFICNAHKSVDFFWVKP